MLEYGARVGRRCVSTPCVSASLLAPGSSLLASRLKKLLLNGEARLCRTTIFTRLIKDHGRADGFLLVIWLCRFGSLRFFTLFLFGTGEHRPQRCEYRLSLYYCSIDTVHIHLG